MDRWDRPAPRLAAVTDDHSAGLQPALHGLTTLVAAPGMLLSAADGHIRPGGLEGWYVADLRLLDHLELSVAGSPLDVVQSRTSRPDRHEFSYVARGLGDRGADPTVRVDRVRSLTEGGFRENCTVSSTAQEPVDVVLRLAVGAHQGRLDQVRRGEPGPATDVDLDSQPAAEAEPGCLVWRFRLAPGESREFRVGATTTRRGVFPGGRPTPFRATVTATDLRVERTATTSLADLGGLLLCEGGDAFAAAGAPWYLTLFGRDSLWTARMLLPYAPDLALSTLRVLAGRQGSRTDHATEEEAGKILHEVRAGHLDIGDGRVLPPVYYGSIDATPLWVLTLADASDWGAPRSEVAPLLPTLRACLEWIVAATRETGWLRYVDHTGRGLANQGWKDSHDSVRYADGGIAEPPIALAEVQAYAHEAAIRGARLLSAHDLPPVGGLLDWAEDARARFRRDFWADSPDGGHPAIALDREGRRADSLTSNIGHLLGTGILDDVDSDRVAGLLVDPRLDSGFGLRTLAADNPAYSGLSYHCGSVWPHDTAIAIRGLARGGHLDEAATLAKGLFAASEHVGHRMPEMYGGDAARDGRVPLAHPAACRPQAWSAAAPLAALVALAGLDADGESGEVTAVPRTTTTLGAYSVHGLRSWAGRFDLHVDPDGAVRVTPGP